MEKCLLEHDESKVSGGDFMEPKIVGVMFEHSDKTVSYWDGFSLTNDDQETIGIVLSKYDTEGYSVRGTLRDVLNELIK